MTRLAWLAAAFVLVWLLVELRSLAVELRDRRWAADEALFAEWVQALHDVGGFEP